MLGLGQADRGDVIAAAVVTAAGRSDQRRDGAALLVDRLAQGRNRARLRRARSAADAGRHRRLSAPRRRGVAHAGPHAGLQLCWASVRPTAETSSPPPSSPPQIDRISVEMAQHYWWIDSRKAETELGFAARDPQLTLVDTVGYLRQGVEA